MKEAEETAYIQGSRAAWARMLSHCLQALGYDGSETQRLAWITEREESVLVLRRICAEYGDNDWPETLHLADILEKHLEGHLD